MKESLTDLWGAWMQAAGHGSTFQRMLSKEFFERQALPALAKAGFKTTSRKSLSTALAAGLDPLPSGTFWHREGLCVSFAHVLNLIWAPVIEYIELCAHDPAPEWTAQLALHEAAVLSEMAGAVMGAQQPMEMDALCEDMRENLLRLLHVDVPKEATLAVISQVVPLHAEPTPATVLHILRSGLCQKLVGKAMAAQANRLVLAEIADVPVGLISPVDANLQVRQELVAILHRQLCGPSDDEKEPARPAKFRRTKEAIAETMATKTSQVLYMLEHKLGG